MIQPSSISPEPLADRISPRSWMGRIIRRPSLVEQTIHAYANKYLAGPREQGDSLLLNTLIEKSY